MGYTNMNTDPDLYYDKSKNRTIRSIVFISMYPKHIYRQKEQNEELSYIVTLVFTTSNLGGGGGCSQRVIATSRSFFN